jgi:hypothetical protein
VTDRALDVLDSRRARIEVDRRDVDADACDVFLVREPVLPQAIGGAKQTSLLGTGDGCEGGQIRRAAPGSHLYEGNHRTEASEQIDLEVSDAEVLREDGVAACHQEIAHHPLGPLPQVDVR